MLMYRPPELRERWGYWFLTGGREIVIEDACRDSQSQEANDLQKITTDSAGPLIRIHDHPIKSCTTVVRRQILALISQQRHSRLMALSLVHFDLHSICALMRFPQVITFAMVAQSLNAGQQEHIKKA